MKENPEEKKKKARFLFIEADGFWTGVQKRGVKIINNKRKTKLKVVHEGWEKRQAGGGQSFKCSKSWVPEHEH